MPSEIIATCNLRNDLHDIYTEVSANCICIVSSCLFFLGSPKSNAHALRFVTVFAPLEQWRNPTACETEPVYFNATKDRLRSGRLTKEPFAEKPTDNLASISFCTELEANRDVSGGATHNSVQFVTVKKLQRSLESRNCRNRHSRDATPRSISALL